MIQNAVASVWEIYMFDIRKFFFCVCVFFSVNTYTDHVTLLDNVEEFSALRMFL